MKKFSIVNALILFGIFTSNFAYSQKKHVILVTIDGFRPDFYLTENWSTPNLHQMVKEGAHAYGVNSVFPSITYPSHTTIVTGVQPAKHGIFYNAMFEPDSVLGKIYWRYDQITAPTIWEVATKSGMTVASLMWPASAGVPNTFNLSDIGSMGHKTLIAYENPKGIYETLRKEVFGNTDKIEFDLSQLISQLSTQLESI